MKKRGCILVIFLMVFLINLVSAMTINVSSPINNGVYASNPISIDATSDGVVNWTLYLNGNQLHKATNTNTLSYSISPIENVSHTIRISISNSSATIDENRSFYVDTASPVILSQTPANGENVSRGSVSFSVTYTEANLNSTKIHYNSSSNPVLKE